MFVGTGYAFVKLTIINIGISPKLHSSVAMLHMLNYTETTTVSAFLCCTGRNKPFETGLELVVTSNIVINL